MKVKDHLGNDFPTIVAMATYYGMSYTTLYKRLQTMTLEEALTTKTRKHHYKTMRVCRGLQCADYKGTLYPSVAAMCVAHGIPRTLYYSRLRRGASKKEALSPLPEVPDGKGNVFQSIESMCKHYKISVATFRSKVYKGMSIAEALDSCLTKPTDHLGNVYRSEREMCKAHGITYNCYRGRVNRFGKGDVAKLLAPVRRNKRWHK